MKMGNIGIVIKWLTGHGILLLLFVWTNTVPTQAGTTEVYSDNLNLTTDSTVSGKKLAGLSDIINSTTDDPSPTVAIKNVETSTSIVKFERARKAIDLLNAGSISTNSSSIQMDNSTSTTTMGSVGHDPAELTAKLPTANNHSNLETSGSDAPPKPKESLNQKNAPTPKPIKSVEPRFLYIPSTKAPANERDKMIQDIFGGECTFEIWNKCNRIKFWGGDYLVPDKLNPEEMIVKHHKIKCVSESERTLCLKNGWTIARCHMLCMSQCNIEFRMNFDDLVLHEGDCRFPLLI